MIANTIASTNAPNTPDGSTQSIGGHYPPAGPRATHGRRSTGRWAALLLPLSLLPFATPAFGGSFELRGFVAADAGHYDAAPSWLNDSFGRLLAGDDETIAGAKSHLVLDWQTSPATSVHANAVARYEEDSRGDAAGIAEAYVQADRERSDRSRFRARIGAFFLPTSRENSDEGWTSPYTITFSALNSWIGEELRPIGVDLEHRWSWSGENRFTVGGTLFGGNDTLGTLIAWRGWSMHDRITVIGERLPLPPLRSFDEVFVEQRRDGTRPFGSDLDGRAGWAARTRWSSGDRVVLQIAHLNNETDRELHRGEYAWETRFTTWGGEVNAGSATILFEYLFGSTGMGRAGHGFVQLDYSAGYALVSWRIRNVRASARYDSFSADERDGSIAESNDDAGEAWTVAVFWEPLDRLRVGVEVLDLDAERPAARESGFQGETGGRSLRFEARLRF